jgi:hypothetical protein
MIAGLNALSRRSFVVEPCDIVPAWNVAVSALSAMQRIMSQAEDEKDLTPQQRQRASLVTKIIKVVSRTKKQGITRSDIQRGVKSLHAFTAKELDELFAYMEQELEGETVFKLPVAAQRKNGRLIPKQLYFATTVWSREEAAMEVELVPPTWNSVNTGYVDAMGNTHSRLEDCFGYRESWKQQVKEPRE